MIYHSPQTGRKAAIGDEPDGPLNKGKKPQNHNKNTEKKIIQNFYQFVNSFYAL